MKKITQNDLPSEILTRKVAPHLDIQDLNQASLVSTHWASSFGDKLVYTNKLLAEYGIEKEQYQEFTALQKNSDYKKFYLRFKQLYDAMLNNLSVYDSPRKYFATPLLFDPAKRTSMVLMLCADDLDYFKEHFGHLSENQLATIGGMAAVTNSRKIGDYCFNKMHDKYTFLNSTAEAGNLAYVKDLLNRKHGAIEDKNSLLDLEPGILTMRRALKSGNEALISFLEKDYGFSPLDQKDWAAENGELKALSYIKKRESKQVKHPEETAQVRKSRP